MAAKAEAWIRMHGQDDGDEIVYLQFNLVGNQLAAPDLAFANETEFTYQGHMYDLISRKDSNGVAIFKCYSDTKETQAVAELDKKINSGQSPVSNNHKPSPLKDLFKYYLANQPKAFVSPSFACIGFYTPSESAYISSIFYAVVIPPPDQSLS